MNEHVRSRVFVQNKRVLEFNGKGSVMNQCWRYEHDGCEVGEETTCYYESSM